MTEYSNQSRAGGDYEWHYEYYDEEEPVSFEGLRANRYSIVIGFWVGLAVFVIFMFFVLTLLTKTGAPRLEIPDPSEKHDGLGECVLEVRGHVESHSLFHFYIHEEERARAGRGAVIGRGRRSGRGQTDEDEHFLSSFNIPNYVNSEPPIISDSQSAAPKSLEPAHSAYDVIQY
ncbi:hypothetical protein R3I93_019261 [Phoxinus phoxinus]|uniref:Melanocortin 2 receptor accessory protein 2 n=1 Tax=Phoxinus phoxinus TaxID=58324 RepID=A0AAN9CAJ6_9TELE